VNQLHAVGACKLQGQVRVLLTSRAQAKNCPLGKLLKPELYHLEREPDHRECVCVYVLLEPLITDISVRNIGIQLHVGSRYCMIKRICMFVLLLHSFTSQKRRVSNVVLIHMWYFFEVNGSLFGPICI
jgi:hypothetical protein